MTGAGALPGLYGAVFQTGYVTEDLDRAIALFAEHQGIADWFRLPPGRLPTPGGGEMEVEIAMAFVGPTMVEIIATRGGDDGLYRAILPPGQFAVRLHHLGFRLHSEEEWQAMLALVERRGYPIALTAQSASTKAIYIDTRAALGHYIEYLWYFDEPRSSIPRVPQNR